MQKTINKLRKKLKQEKKLNQKLDDEIVQYHYDIIILDHTNFTLEQENSQLQKKIREYEEIYSSFTKILNRR